MFYAARTKEASLSGRKKGPGVFRTLVRIVLLALLFGFVPWFLYQAACGKQTTRSLEEAYGVDKPFGAPPTAPTPGKNVASPTDGGASKKAP